MPPEQIEIQPIEVTNETAERHAELHVKSEKVEELERLHAAEPHAEPHTELEEKTNKSLPTLPDQVKEANRTDVLFTKVREYFSNPEDHDQPTNVYLRGSRAANGLLYKDNKLWVAEDLRLDVIREVHDQPAMGHAGVQRTILLIQQHYFWPKMKMDINQFIRSCHVCR